jgi:predicted DNA-binding mobile mystery protein A
MHTPLKLLRVRQIDERTQPWRQLAEQEAPRRGWIRAIRQAVGMTTSQLASRLGVSRQAVVDLQRREVEGGVTLSALRKAADAMDCDLLYAIVPRRPVKEMLWNRARAVATKRLERIAHSMHLEDQGVPSDEHKQEVEDLAAQLMRDFPRGLWSEEVTSRPNRRASA